MKQLELRFYDRNEIAEALSLNITKNFARDVKGKLDKLGYKYSYSRKGVEIEAVPAAAADKLKEIMLRQFNLDIRIDTYAFACFMCLLMEDAEFTSMPWSVREQALKDLYGISISERTLRAWNTKLIKENIIHNDKQERTNWRTRYNAALGIKVREWVDGNEEMEQEMQQYMKHRKILYAATKDWDNTLLTLWKEFGCCYYSCSTLVLNGLGEEAQEIYELVKEVAKNGK